MAEVAQEEGDDDRAQDSADRRSEGEGDAHVGGDAAFFVDVPELFGHCRGDGGCGEQERKSRGSLTVEAAEQSGGDGDAAARSAWNYCKGLSGADHQAV